MTTSIAMYAGGIPSPTPQHAQSLSPEQLQDHRQKIAFDVEVVLDGYWDRRPPESVKAGILADFADTLQDWTQEQVLYGLRKWRNENPNRKPNPGHILAILKQTRGEREMAKMKAMAKPEPVVKPALSVEERKRIAEQAMQAAGFSVQRFGGAS